MHIDPQKGLFPAEMWNNHLGPSHIYWPVLPTVCLDASIDCVNLLRKSSPWLIFFSDLFSEYSLCPLQHRTIQSLLACLNDGEVVCLDLLGHIISTWLPLLLFFYWYIIYFILWCNEYFKRYWLFIAVTTKEYLWWNHDEMPRFSRGKKSLC